MPQTVTRAARKPKTFTTRAAASVAACVTPATIRQWIAKGWLDPAGPWSRADLTAAGRNSRQRAGRGTTAAHGTASRWMVGCRCRRCAEAHTAETTAAWDRRRQAQWDAGPADRLIAAILQAGSYRDALDAAGVSAQAVTGQRRRDPAFAARLDAALTETRDPDLAHGTNAAWHAGCRCPECREYHNDHR